MTRIRIGVTLLAMTLLAASYQEKDKDKKAEEPTKLKGQLPANFKRLGLSEEQVQKVYKLRADTKAKINDLEKQIKKLREDEKEALEKILTPDQRKRLKELRTGEKTTDK